VLLETAHQKHFKGLIAPTGTAALAMVREVKPAAVTLDIHLPDLDGWQVLSRLKRDLAVRHIPVQIITVDEGAKFVEKQGALACLTKSDQQEALNRAFEQLRQFVDRPMKNLLLVEQDEAQRNSILELIGNSDVRTIAVGTAQDALVALRSERFDCVIVPPALPDMTCGQLLEEMARESRSGRLPVILYAMEDLPPQEDARLKSLPGTLLVKSVRSPERLLDETSLCLHRNTATLPERQRRILEGLHESALAGKKALIVDDDIRNIFAMTSMLERFKMSVISAEAARRRWTTC
jgi:CheY-like chemotaxis protein